MVNRLGSAQGPEEYERHYGNNTASACHHESIVQNFSDGSSATYDLDEDQQHHVAASTARQDWQPSDGSDDNGVMLGNSQQSFDQDDNVQQADPHGHGDVVRCPDNVSTDHGRHPVRPPQFQDFGSLHHATLEEQEPAKQAYSRSERKFQQVLARPHTGPSPRVPSLNSRGAFQEESRSVVPQAGLGNPQAMVTEDSARPAWPQSDHVPLANTSMQGQDEHPQQAPETSIGTASSEAYHEAADDALVDSRADSLHHNDITQPSEPSPPLFSRRHRNVFQPSFARRNSPHVPRQSYKLNPAPHLSISRVVQARTCTEAPTAHHESHTGNNHAHTAVTDSMRSDKSALTAAMHHVIQVAQHQAKTLSDGHEAERKFLSSELHQALSHKQALADEIQAIRSEKEELQKLVEKQVSRLGAFEAKAGRFKVFVHGLGNDLVALKRDSQTQRHTAEQLVGDLNQRRATQEALLCQVAACTEKTVQLKSDAIKTAQGLQASLSHATLRVEHLMSDLQIKNQLLAEEKETTLRLQQQLDAASSNNDSVIRQIKSNGISILDKLFEMHAEMDQHFKTQQVTEMVEKMAAAVQGLNSQQAATAVDIASVKSLVESCTESMRSRSITMNDQGADPGPAFKTQLDDALKSLKADLCNQELITQDVINRETIFGLRQKLASSEELVSQQAVDIKSLRKSEAELKQQCAVTQAQVVSLSTERARRDESQLNKINAELELKTSKLEAAWAEISTKESDLRKLLEDKIRLEEEVQSLQQGLETALASTPTFDDERCMLERKHAAKLDSIRKEMSRHANDFKAAEHARVENEMRKVVNDRDKLAEKIQSLEGTLAAVKDQATATRTLQQELTGLRQQFESAGREIDSLRSQKEELAITVEKNNSIQEDYAALNARFSALQQQLQLVVDEKTTLGKRIEGLTHAEFHLKQQLKESYDTNRQFEAASRAKLTVEEERHEKNLNALQKRLVEAESEFRRNEEELSQYKSQNEASWSAQEDRHRQELAMARDRATQAESRENKIFADNERLRAELAASVQQQPREANLLGSASVSADNPGGGPRTKPQRKIVDHRKPSEVLMSLADTGYSRQSPSPTLRSLFDCQDAFTNQGPVFEQSQQQEVVVGNSQPQGGVHVEEFQQQIAFEPPEALDILSSPLSLTQSQDRGHLGLADTHDGQSQTEALGSLLRINDGFEDSLPSFSQFNRDQANPSTRWQGRDFDLFEGRSDAPSATTPNLAKSLHDPPSRSGLKNNALQSLMPPPNSSMKRARSVSVDPRASLSRESSTTANKSASYAAGRFAKTPEPHTKSSQGGSAFEQAHQESPARSSSPAFMANATARSGNRSQELNSAVKDKPSQVNVSSQVKRKTSPGISEGFENERKRHRTRARSSLRSGSQPQIKGKSERGFPSSKPSDATATASVQTQTSAPKRGAVGGARATRGQRRCLRMTK